MSRTKNAELPERRRARTEQLSRAFLIWRGRREQRREDSGYFQHDPSPRGDRIAVPASGSKEYPRQFGGFSYSVE